ncbi:MAG: OAM dimerization domain-containing protein [Anaerolineaceae bacterium]
MIKTYETSRIRPFGIHKNDGVIQISFSLPLQNSKRAKRIALEVARKMGIMNCRIVHSEEFSKDISFFIIYGNLYHSIDQSLFAEDPIEEEPISKIGVEELLINKLRKDITIVGATTGTDAHSLGLNLILNAKGIAGYEGLESYEGFRIINLGSQIPNEILIQKAVSEKADVILISQTVTENDLHISNLQNFINLINKDNLRDQFLLIVGGAQISEDLAEEIGFDKSFSKECNPCQVASYIVTELIKRKDNIA